MQRNSIGRTLILRSHYLDSGRTCGETAAVLIYTDKAAQEEYRSKGKYGYDHKQTYI